MTTSINISLSSTEIKALEVDIKSVQEWADNALTNRARIAMDHVIQKLVAHCNENEIAMAVGKDAQVDQAYELGIVTALKDAPDQTSIVAPE